MNLLNGGLFYPALAYSALELAAGVAAAGVFKVTHAVDLDGAEKEKLMA